MIAEAKFLDRLTGYLRNHRSEASMIFHRLVTVDGTFLVRNQIQDVCNELVIETQQPMMAALTRAQPTPNPRYLVSGPGKIKAAYDTL